MAQLRDYSDLKDTEAAEIEIPLNGEVYYADPEPPAETVLSASGARSGSVELVEELIRQGIDEKDPEAMKRLAEQNPVLGMRLAVAGMSNTERMIKFLQDVLTPESALRWAQNMRAHPPAPKDAPGDWKPPKKELEAHRKRRITLRQCVAVYQGLQEQYGKRPTEPSSPSQNGHDGSGGTSTAGARAGV